MSEDFRFLKSFMSTDSDSKIIILQGNLKDLGYFFTNMMKNFDLYTKSNIMNLQNNNSIFSKDTYAADDWGLLSPKTDDYLVTDTRPTLRLGSTGPYVIELQEILTKLLYYTGTIDGNFGPNTENAVKRFQINNRLTADGVVGRDTWSALSSLYSPLAICEEEPGQDYFLYTVVAGDTLWSIARRFQTTVEAIKSLNGLTSDLLSIGQVLKIPSENNEPTYILYTVVAGDTLWSIARRFQTTVEAIKSLNGLTSDLLSIGQVLKIPSENNEPTYILYTVVAGDTLWSIARRFQTTVEAIKSLNGLTSNLLSIGQVLRIPSN